VSVIHLSLFPFIGHNNLFLGNVYPPPGFLGFPTDLEHKWYTM
jgi:hypothetical protein